MPIPDAYRSIFDTLREQTKGGQVQWQEGANPTEFLVSLERFTIKVARESIYITGPNFKLSLLDSAGTELDSFELREHPFGLDSRDKDYDLMQELWSDARRSALNLQDVLHQVQQELNKLGSET